MSSKSRKRSKKSRGHAGAAQPASAAEADQWDDQSESDFSSPDHAGHPSSWSRSPQRAPHGGFDSRMLAAVGQISALCAQNHIESVVPHDIIIGTQGAGKTSFLESLIHFPLGGRDNDDRVGNVGPVRYALTHDNEKVTPIVKIRYPHDCGHGDQGQTITVAPDQLHEHLAEWRDRVQDGSVKPNANGFTMRELTVEIHSSSVPSYVVVDMPGLQTFDADHPAAPIIARCMAQLARLESYGIVVVNPLPDNADTAFGIGALDRVMRDDSLFSDDAHDWSEFPRLPKPRNYWRDDAIVVFTKADSQLGGAEVDFGKINTYFDRYSKYFRGDGGFTIVSLNPLQINKDNKEFDDVVRHLNGLEDKECEFFDKVFHRIHHVPRNTNLDSHIAKWKKNCGLSVTTKRIQDRLMRRFVSAFPKIVGAIEEKISDIRDELVGLNKLCDVTDPDKQFDLIQEYVADFVENFHALLVGGVTNGLTLDETLGGPNVRRRGRRAFFDPDVIGNTIEEEMSMMTSSPAPFEVPNGSIGSPSFEGYLPTNDHDLVEFIKSESTEFKDRSVLKLTGCAALERWIGAFRKVLLARECIPLTLDKVVQMSHGNAVDPNKIIRTAVTVQFDCARQGLPWLQHKLSWLLNHFEKLVHKYLLGSSKYATLRPVAKKLATLVHAGVIGMRDPLLEKLRDQWSEEVQRRHFFFNVNHVAHTIIALIKTPWTLIPLHPAATRPQDFTSDPLSPFKVPRRQSPPQEGGSAEFARSRGNGGHSGSGNRPPLNVARGTGPAAEESASAAAASAGSAEEAASRTMYQRLNLSGGVQAGLRRNRSHDVELAVVRAFDPEGYGKQSEKYHKRAGSAPGASSGDQAVQDFYSDLPAEMQERLQRSADAKLERALEPNFSDFDLQRILLSVVIEKLSQSFDAFSIDNMHDLNLLVLPAQYQNVAELEQQLPTLNGYVEQFYRFTMFELSHQFSMYSTAYISHPLTTDTTRLQSCLTKEVTLATDHKDEYMPEGLEEYISRRDARMKSLEELVTNVAYIKALQRELDPNFELPDLPGHAARSGSAAPVRQRRNNFDEDLDKLFDGISQSSLVEGR